MDRLNLILIQMIRSFIVNDDKWEFTLAVLQLHIVLFLKSLLDCQLNLLIFGQEVRLPLEIIFRPKTAINEFTSSYGTCKTSVF